MRRVTRLVVVLSLVLAASPPSFSFAQGSPKPARYLYVWATSGHHDAPGTGMVAVLDADPSSKRYGSVVTVLTVDTAARMPHHTEFSPPTNSTSFFANDFGADRSWVIDFSTPNKPRVAGRVMAVPGARTMHSFARLPNGHVLATLQFGDGKLPGNPGALAEFDKTGKLIRSGSSADKAFASGKIRTYGLVALPKIDRVVTTSSPMDDEIAEDVVQVWRLSNLQLLNTVALPKIAGDSAHRYPFELRSTDGETVMLNSYYCGFYRLTGLDKKPAIERTGSFNDIGCAVPYTIGKMMVMPVAYGHRIATLDMTNPDKPVEKSSLAVDSTFFPHWVSGDRGTNRIVVTDQGDGVPRVMIGIVNTSTGFITWDDKFRDAGSTKPGVSLAEVNWPNGVKGKVMAHGALFIK